MKTLQQLREEAALSQSDLGARETVSLAERGRCVPRAATIRAWAEKLGTEPKTVVAAIRATQKKLEARAHGTRRTKAGAR